MLKRNRASKVDEQLCRPQKTTKKKRKTPKKKKKTTQKKTQEKEKKNPNPHTQPHTPNQTKKKKKTTTKKRKKNKPVQTQFTFLGGESLGGFGPGQKDENCRNTGNQRKKFSQKRASALTYVHSRMPWGLHCKLGTWMAAEERVAEGNKEQRLGNRRDAQLLLSEGNPTILRRRRRAHRTQERKTTPRGEKTTSSVKPIHTRESKKRGEGKRINTKISSRTVVKDPLIETWLREEWGASYD